MLGYYHNFTFANAYGCIITNTSISPDLNLNVCFSEVEAIRKWVNNKQVEFTIQFPYTLNTNFGEKAYILLDNKRFEVTSAERNAYKAITPNIEASRLSINIIRPTGGPMTTTFRVIKNEFSLRMYISWILLIASSSVFIAISIFGALEVFKQLRKKGKLSTSQSATGSARTPSRFSYDIAASKISSF